MGVPLVYRSTSLDPFENLALERVLADALRPDEALLYLWRNARTVVLGRNQNAWAECAVEALEADGGHLARRPSGGGAVFHDVGNLNFTFASSVDDYSLERNLEVVRSAVAGFGIDARLSGRNDVTVDGMKFSGNAFFRSRGVQVHHGTLMVDVDTSLLGRYLNPDVRKLQAHGVASVRSRVVNLASLNACITIDALSEALCDAFAKSRGTAARAFPSARLEEDALQDAYAHFASWEWRFGSARPFTDVVEGRFSWGGVEFRLNVVRGSIESADVVSDALDAAYVEQLARSVCGIPYRPAAWREALAAVGAADSDQALMRADCERLLSGA